MHGAKPNPHRQLGALQDGTGDQRCLIATAPALQQLTIADLAGCAPRTLEALRPAPGKPRPAAGLLVRIKPFEGIIREALLVLHAIARHRSYPENLRDFRMMILNRRLSVDGKQDKGYRTLQTMVIVGWIALPLGRGRKAVGAAARYVRPLRTGISARRDSSGKRSA